MDTLTYAGSTANVTVDLLGNTASGFDSISGIENVTGGSGNDTLIGDSGVNSPVVQATTPTWWVPAT